MNTTTLHEATHLIPNIPGARTTVSYLVDDPEQVKAIAADVGTLLRECHYEATDRRWILVAEWQSGDVHLKAQSSGTLTPSLAA